MPAFDKTGPRGQGPMTGRSMGHCGGGFGMGMGFGRGRGSGPRGLGRYFGWNWPQAKADQKTTLADYRKALEEELEDVKKEAEELNKAE